MIFKAGFLQFNPILGDIEGNISQIEALAGQPGDLDLLVLPELASTGYNFDSREQAMDLSEELNDSRFISFLVRIAAEKQCHLVAGINEREGELLYNTAVLVGPEGYVGKYRKMHLFMNEKDIFEPGNAGLPVFEIGGIKTGILICFDYFVPEIWRILAEKGADVICHPSNLLTENAFRTVPGLALINRVFVVTANRTGTDKDLHFCGKSMVVGTTGEILAQADTAGDVIQGVELDIEQARNKWITRRNHVFEDRRPEADYLESL